MFCNVHKQEIVYQTETLGTADSSKKISRQNQRARVEAMSGTEKEREEGGRKLSSAEVRQI